MIISNSDSNYVKYIRCKLKIFYHHVYSCWHQNNISFGIWVHVYYLSPVAHKLLLVGTCIPQILISIQRLIFHNGTFRIFRYLFFLCTVVPKLFNPSESWWLTALAQLSLWTKSHVMKENDVILEFIFKVKCFMKMSLMNDVISKGINSTLQHIVSKWLMF